MNHIVKIPSILCLFLLATLITSAQNNYAVNAKGKIESLDNNAWLFKRVDALKLSASKASSLKKCLETQLNVINHSPLVNPPVGFNAKTFFNIEGRNGSTANAGIEVDFFYLMHDNTGSVKASQDGTSVSLLTNNIEHLCEQQGNFWKDCSELKIPEFFEAFPVTDSTANYIELNFGKYGYAHSISAMPVRIVTGNNKPLFVPLTRREYVQYLIAKKKNEIAESQKSLKDLEKEIADTKKEVDEPVYKSIKETLLTSINTLQSQEGPVQLKIKKYNDQLQDLNHVLKNMPSGEASMPARLDEEKVAEDDLYGLSQLLSPGSNAGVLLNKVNPDYFDRSSAAPAAQLIIVTGGSSLFSRPADQLNYLQKKTLELFNHLDYHKLKESMN